MTENLPDTLNFYKIAQSVSALSDEEWNWLVSQLQTQSFDAGNDLFYPGSSDAGLHFIQQGLVRYYYSNEEGIERNHGFAAENNLVGCFPVFAGFETCPLTVQALEQTRTLYIPSDIVRQFSDRHPCWAQFQMRLMAHVALRKSDREKTLLLDSPEKRYLSFLDNFSEIVNRVPQYHIASYIGITPVALSRIRARINRV
jgi:CRP-like cAMP-binding protein